MPYADYSVHLARNRERQKTDRGSENHVRANRAYRNRNKQKRAAHNAVARALMASTLQTWPVCALPECCETKAHAHHADYSNPLGVTWLCDPHHKQAHAMVSKP